MICVLSAPCDKSYAVRLRLIYVSPTSACQIFTGTYIRLHGYIVQPFEFLLLWLLLTSHSSLLLRLMKPPVRPHGISSYSFLVFPLDLRLWVTATFWALLFSVNSPAINALISSFCSSGYDFAIPSSCLYLAAQTLGVAIKFVGSYAYVDFHHRTQACPSYWKKPGKPVIPRLSGHRRKNSPPKWKAVFVSKFVL